jgi:hypothetical protein
MPDQQTDGLDEGWEYDTSTEDPFNAFASSSYHHSVIQYNYNPTLDAFGPHTHFQGYPN